MGAYVAVSVVQVAIDAVPPHRVRGVVGVGHGKALQDAELRFDQVFCPPAVANGKVYVATMDGLSHKVTLGETALGRPAMANRNDHDLVFGWSGPTTRATST